MQYVWFITHDHGRVSRFRDYMNPLRRARRVAERAAAVLRSTDYLPSPVFVWADICQHELHESAAMETADVSSITPFV